MTRIFYLLLVRRTPHALGVESTDEREAIDKEENPEEDPSEEEGDLIEEEDLTGEPSEGEEEPIEEEGHEEILARRRRRNQ